MLFNKDYNIIVGDRASGKTFLLWNVSKILTEFGYKVGYIAGTDEYKGDESFWSHLPLFRTVNPSSSKRDIELVSELIKRDKYDYLMIDDVDVIDPSLFKYLKNISVRKIMAVWNKIPVIGTTDFNLFKVSENYDDSNMEVKQTVEYKGSIYERNDFLKSYVRELKINNLLK